MRRQPTQARNLHTNLRSLERRWQRAVSNFPLADDTWHYSRPLRPADPTQGWKLHLAATPFSAAEVLSRVQPLLRAAGVLFKVPRHLATLTEMNAGMAHFSQVGKFLTLYPRSRDEAITLAAALHQATRDLRGPEIPFDKRYRKNSLVYYRYGSFGGKTTDKAKEGTLRDPTGKVHRDRRVAGAAIPAWLEDPFQKGRRPLRPPRGPVGEDYLAFRALVQRGKGGVYEALDLSVSPARRVILKEGRRQGEIDLLGCDGYARVKHEARLLRLLHRRGLPVPAVCAEFTQDDKRYLVLEKVAGRPLLPRRRLQPTRPLWRRAERILNRLVPLVVGIHEAGWVWRDCKPSHIFLHRGAIQLIDFEGACRLDDSRALPWSSPFYTPPDLAREGGRRKGTVEDDYALGVIAFQFGTGEFPSLQRQERARVYRRTRCPADLRERIEALLRRAKS